MCWLNDQKRGGYGLGYSFEGGRYGAYDDIHDLSFLCAVINGVSVAWSEVNKIPCFFLPQKSLEIQQDRPFLGERPDIVGVYHMIRLLDSEWAAHMIIKIFHNYFQITESWGSFLIFGNNSLCQDVI